MKRVLLLTNSEHGQANVYLAVSHSLLSLERDVEVHLASFTPIQKFVNATSEYAQERCKHGKSVVFHKVRGIDMQSAWSRPEIGGGDPMSNSTRGIFNVTNKVRLLLRVTMPWSGPEFVEIYRSIVEIIQDVQPDIIAVDPAFSPALTACRHLGVKFVLLTPNTIKDFAMPLQPNLEALWKYPCVGSGIPYPVPWYLIPLNILLIFISIYIGVHDERKKKIQQYVFEQTGGTHVVTLNDLSLNPRLGIKTLVANLPEIEFPLKVIPRHVVPCGPLIRPAKQVSQVDPVLARWLSHGPTIYINLGTHVLTNEDTATEMATALRIVLDHARSPAHKEAKMETLQVLWKLLRHGDYEVHSPKSRVHAVLGRYMDTDVVRIVEWIEPEPTAVLEDENVVCSVHHGGANSFLESVSAGKPQIVLPVWIDTFDFANRAELLGIGLWGNKTARPGCKAYELGPALIKLLLGQNALRIKEKAQALARLCGEDGGGRVKAAKVIVEEIEGDD